MIRTLDWERVFIPVTLEGVKEMISTIHAGSIFVNGIVKSDLGLPFGGIKRSGVGRDLSQEGARAFTNVKTVWIK